MHGKKTFWSFRAQTDDTPAELLLYGPISSDSWWGDETTPAQFDADLKALGNISDLTVRINSDGGDVFAGQAIHSMLKRHPANVTVLVDGLAASIASVVAMAGDKVMMPRNAMMMIHNPWTIAMGNSADFRKLADDMDSITQGLIAAYQGKTGMDPEQIQQMMSAETWMTADEAVANGFADEIEPTKQMAASLSGGHLVINGQEFDLGRFRNAPKLFFLPKAGVSPPDVSRVKAPEDETWEKPTLGDFTDKNWGDLTDTEKKSIAGHYAWAADMPPATFGDLKFPHHDPKDGDVVWAGVANCAARLPQADIPEADVQKVRDHLGSHYKQFDKTPPWEEGQNNLRNEGRTLSAANEKKIREARDGLNEVLDSISGKTDPPALKEDEQTDNGLLSLLALKAQAQKNKITGGKR